MIQVVFWLVIIHLIQPNGELDEGEGQDEVRRVLLLIRGHLCDLWDGQVHHDVLLDRALRALLLLVVHEARLRCDGHAAEGVDGPGPNAPPHGCRGGFGPIVLPQNPRGADLCFSRAGCLPCVLAVCLCACKYVRLRRVPRVRVLCTCVSRSRECTLSVFSCMPVCVRVCVPYPCHALIHCDCLSAIAP